MPNNLWEIIKFDDLVYLLRNAEKRFVVLSIITEDTDESIKKMIKVFVKEKSKLYPRVTFLFYKAKKQDFGRLQPMFDKDITKYPKLFHVWDVKEILTGVLAVDNKEIIEKSFEDLHNVYLAGVLPERKERKEEINNTQDSYTEGSQIKVSRIQRDALNSENDENDEDTRQSQMAKTKQNNATQKQNPKQNPNLNPNPKQQQQQPPQIQQQYKDPAMEKRKFIEKLQLLRKKQEESTLEFLNEFKKRKEEEEGEGERDGESGKKKKDKKKNK